tara:strand:+ start:65 stop:361 length:297 start_codon:yes stop_codon:yes gene_type:complete
MSRYKDTNMKVNYKTSDRKQTTTALETTIYKEIPKRDSDIYLITQVGDRLDNLANKFYNDSSLWWYIAQANNLFSIHLEPNTSLRVPVDLTYADSEQR